MPATEILYKERPEDFERAASAWASIGAEDPRRLFLRGVIKVADAQLLAATAELFEHSVLLLAQEYFYTEYDWRIGVLNRKPIFACQYFMSKGTGRSTTTRRQGPGRMASAGPSLWTRRPSVVELAVRRPG
jgi:hypothetical protein